ncbi:MAG: HAD family hydrolase [Pseudomonadota bacterium]|nr:HAD family hydrolase [Burkholderia sp. PAMC 28687]AMM17450.1 HAD family hydrolase [Burkholderia sp. PAMC 28687]MDP9153483.1 HAD family hydrolase [Pseudomonadota bacterium]
MKSQPIAPAPRGPDRAVFLDKDGTLLVDVPYNVKPELMQLAPGAREALQIFSRLEVPLYVISNQSGVALGKFPVEALDAVEDRLHELVSECGATLSGVYWCFHHPEGMVAPYNRSCDCRKPLPGMLLNASDDHHIALASSWFIGDILDDVEAGNRSGCRTILIDNGNETVWRRGPYREPLCLAPDLHEAARVIEKATQTSELVQ